MLVTKILRWYGGGSVFGVSLREIPDYLLWLAGLERRLRRTYFVELSDQL